MQLPGGTYTKTCCQTENLEAMRLALCRSSQALPSPTSVSIPWAYPGCCHWPSGRPARFVPPRWVSAASAAGPGLAHCCCHTSMHPTGSHSSILSYKHSVHCRGNSVALSGFSSAASSLLRPFPLSALLLAQSTGQPLSALPAPSLGAASAGQC